MKKKKRVNEIGLSMRVSNAIMREKVITLDKLLELYLSLDEEDFTFKFRNFGPDSYRELTGALIRLGAITEDHKKNEEFILE